MKFVVQRVSEAKVEVDGKLTGEIGKGFFVLIGVNESDTKEVADKMIGKLLKMRIFSDSEGKTNLDMASVGGSLLLVSQFTLYANCKKGNRPSFIKSGSPEFFRISAAFSLPPLIYMWTMFALIRLPKWNGFFKTATCILASVLVYFFNDAIVLGILGNKPRIPSFDFSLTTTESLNNLMCWGGLGIGVVLAVIFTAIGFAKSNKKK